MVKLKVTEASVKKAIMAYLTIMEKMGECYVVRNNSVCGKLTRPDGSVGWIKNNKPGAPDIIACIGGQFVGIEIKGSSGKQSEEQRETEILISTLGGKYVLARSIDDVTELFKEAT